MSPKGRNTLSRSKKEIRAFPLRFPVALFGLCVSTALAESFVVLPYPHETKRLVTLKECDEMMTKMLKRHHRSGPAAMTMHAVIVDKKGNFIHENYCAFARPPKRTTM